MKQHQTPVGKSDEWGTPFEIAAALGEFDLDPCAMPTRLLPNVKWHMTKEDSGLNKPWRGRVWCNPPFNGEVRPQFMERMASHNNGILLIPAACETEPFRKHVFGKASGILMLDSRPYFFKPDGTKGSSNSGCTICLVSYGKQNLIALLNSGLGTVLREAA